MIVASIRSTGKEVGHDGELVLISPDRDHMALLPATAPSSLREALATWDDSLPLLQEIDQQLRLGRWPNTLSTSQVTFTAPLPRTWALLDGSAFIQHVLLVRKARGAGPPADLMTIPLMYQGVSDNLLGPTDDIPLIHESYGMDFEAEVAVITDAVPQGTPAPEAAKHIKLLMLMNDVSLRELIPRELATGFGFFHSKPPSSFSPFALTPDELGTSWREGRLHLPLSSKLNEKTFGHPNAGEMHFSFPELIQHAAMTRPLSAGTIIGSGTVSNEDMSVGSSCIVERRMLELLETGAISTPYLKDGDTLEIVMNSGDVNLFGAIRQRIKRVNN